MQHQKKSHAMLLYEAEIRPVSLRSFLPAWPSQVAVMVVGDVLRGVLGVKSPGSGGLWTAAVCQL
jgi:hypothetical protein